MRRTNVARHVAAGTASGPEIMSSTVVPGARHVQVARAPRGQDDAPASAADLDRSLEVARRQPGQQDSSIVRRLRIHASAMVRA